MRLDRCATRASLAIGRGRGLFAGAVVVRGRAAASRPPTAAAGGPGRLQLGRPADPVGELLPVPRARREGPPREPAPRSARRRHQGPERRHRPTRHRSRGSGQQRADEARHARERCACGCRRPSTNKTLTPETDRHPAPLDCAGRAVQAALGVHLAAEAAVPPVSARGPGAQRHRPVHRRAAAARRADALAGGRQGNADQSRHADADRAAADAGGGRRVREGHAARTPTRRSWIGCSRRRPTASTWPRTGSTSRAIPRATASSTTTTIGCSGRIATG